MIIGIGTDIVEIERIHKIGIERLSKKILTENELQRMPSSDKRRLEYVAGRFAAKEAISKANGTGFGAEFSFLDVEILSTESGAPIVHWKDKDFVVHLSISHSDQYAIAMVVIEKL